MNNTTHELTCIGCPMGCPLELTIEGKEVVKVTGNECRRGDKYARQEFTDPRRMVTTTVACSNGLWSRVPVKTSEAVPKGKVMDIAEALHQLNLQAPVTVGQVVLDDAAGTGIAVIATRSMPVQL